MIDDLQPLIRRYYEQFSRCSDCGHIYRAGSHDKRLRSLVERLRDQL